MALTKVQLVDLNSNELILDLDADTSLHSSTDDQIDIKIGGADDFTFTANTFTALAGSSIVVPDSGLTLGSTAVTSTAAELNLLDGVSGLVQADLTKLAALDATAAEINLIDGGTSTGTTAVADADGIITNDGGTMRLTTAATFKTYFQEGISQAYDDFTIGDAAVLITTSSGNITIDAAANDSDIIFKGTDGGADKVFATFDGSAGGDLFLNGGLIDLKNDGSNVSQIKFYCESSNAHAQTLIGAPHAQSADNTLTLPHGADGVLLSTTSTATVTNKTLTSPVINTGTFGTSILPTSADGTTLGSASKEFSDLFLADASTIQFGADQDVTLTHVADTGLLLNAAMKIQFRDSAISISSTADGDLAIAADDEIDITSTLIDINGNVEISGTATTTGVHTFTAVPVFPNNTIETADIQADAITAAKIADNAVVTAGINADAITAAKIADNAVVTAGINADAVTGAKIADDAINSEHYTDGSIDTAHIADGQITTAKLAGAVFTGATDIGADIADADLFLMDDGAGGTIRKTTAARLKTYIPGLGRVIQYKADYDSASIGLSNTSWTDTNLSIAFTPTSASNRILLKGMVQVYVNGEPSYHGNMEYKVLNGSSDIMETYSAYTGYGGNEANWNGMLPFNVYETNASNTNERTYKVQVRNSDTNSGAHYNQYGGYSALEIWEIDY